VAGVRYPSRRWRRLHAGLLQSSLLPFSEFALLLLVVTNGLKGLHILTDDPNILFYILNFFSDRGSLSLIHFSPTLRTLCHSSTSIKKKCLGEMHESQSLNPLPRVVRFLIKVSIESDQNPSGHVVGLPYSHLLEVLCKLRVVPEPPAVSHPLSKKHVIVAD